MSHGVEMVECAYPLTEEPAERRAMFDSTLPEVAVTCFRVNAPDDWESLFDWEHDAHRWCDVQTAFDTLRSSETAEALRDLDPSN